MPVEVRRISDGAIYPDFQLPGGDGSTQLASAIANGFGTAQTLQVVTVDMPTFLNDVQAAYGAVIAAKNTAHLSMHTAIAASVQPFVGTVVVGSSPNLATLTKVVFALGYVLGAIDDAGKLVDPSLWLP